MPKYLLLVMRMSRWMAIGFLGGLLGALLIAGLPVEAGGTKTVSGKLRNIRGNVLMVEKPGLFSTSLVEVEMNDATEKIGQITPGMHVKIKYREEGVHKIALKIETRPEYASKTAKKAASQTQP